MTAAELAQEDGRIIPHGQASHLRMPALPLVHGTPDRANSRSPASLPALLQCTGKT